MGLLGFEAGGTDGWERLAQRWWTAYERHQRPPRPVVVGRTIEEAEPDECVSHAEVVGEERVGVTEAAHDDVVGGPPADPLECQQLPVGDGGIAADVEFEIAVSDGTGQPTDRVAPRPRHRERFVFVPPPSSSGRGKTRVMSSTGSPNVQTDVLHDPTGDRAGAGNGNLSLADHHREQPSRTDRRWRAPAGRAPPATDRGERRVGSERCVHGGRVAVDRADDGSVGRRRRGDPRRQLDASSNMVVKYADEPDDADAAGQVGERRYISRPASTPGMARSPMNEALSSTPTRTALERRAAP